MTPETRKDQLLTESVGNELVIYDERTHQAHCLNATAAFVWRTADGRRSVPELAAALRESLSSLDEASGASIDSEDSEELVRLALDHLDRSGLLVRALPALGQPMSRRRMIAVSAALLPVVASIVAPTPATAQTSVFSVTATYRHIGPGSSVICITTRAVASSVGQNIAVTVTVTGPGTNITRTNVDVENGTDQERVNISSFGTYTITVTDGSRTASTTVNVTEAQGTCPADFVDD